ncbi:MAG: hypothetical protein KFF49_02200 [Bacteroidales bacterium]|nr:hypothetical protein [Bacteroidales bacterium]
MKDRYIHFIFVLFILLGACSGNHHVKYKSDWANTPDGVWVGPELWANRLQDWRVEDGRLLCINSGPMRTVHLTTRTARGEKGNIHTSVQINIHRGLYFGNEASAGFLIGAGRGLDYRAASLIHHSYGKLGGLFAGLDAAGNLFIRDFEKEDVYLQYKRDNNTLWEKAHIILSLKPGDNDYYSIKITAVDPATNLIIDRLEMNEVEAWRVEGNLALVSHSGYSSGSDTGFSFENWQVSGSKLSVEPHQTIGPIVGMQYTLSRSVLKLNVQMMPLSEQENHKVTLFIEEDGAWRKLSEAEIDRDSFTALFRLDSWDRKEDIPFRIRYVLNRNPNRSFDEYGIIRHDPSDKEEITLLSLSCVEQIVKADKHSWMGIDAGTFPYDWALLYPHVQLTDKLKQFGADVLFFAGDQVYEGASPTAADTGPMAHLDYLYKWFLWCQTYKDLTSTIPTICIPDDHDVYHGNIWGEGGKATPEGLRGAAAQDAGGYKMSPQFVNMVQATQTRHLPDPYDPRPVEQGIGVYFTECNIGGVSFAILEDRKFKSAPRDILPDAEIFNGWPLNLNWNARTRSRIDATLLGERQLDFLEDWASDWSGGTWMKAALSQTLFANLASIPAEAINDDITQVSEVPDSGIILDTDRLVTDFDSNGWPQTGRDRALSRLRKAFATHIAGDQHLGSTVQYGIDSWGDAGFAIISPATGCIWTRRWHPPVEGRNRKEGWPSNLGDFEDGFGNKITVHAVANPHKSTIEPRRHHEMSTGYSSIKFNRRTRDIELANWPYHAGPDKGEPFPFWPVSFNQLDNYGRQALAWLPEVISTGIENPVIRIYQERTGELVYALRINGRSFQPKVFYYGTYTIEIGEPDTDTWQKFEGINATSFKEREAIEVNYFSGMASSVPTRNSQNFLTVSMFTFSSGE